MRLVCVWFKLIRDIMHHVFWCIFMCTCIFMPFCAPLWCQQNKIYCCIKKAVEFLSSVFKIIWIIWRYNYKYSLKSIRCVPQIKKKGVRDFKFQMWVHSLWYIFIIEILGHCVHFLKVWIKKRFYWSSVLWQGASFHQKYDSLGVCMVQWFHQTQ